MDIFDLLFGGLNYWCQLGTFVPSRRGGFGQTRPVISTPFLLGQHVGST